MSRVITKVVDLESLRKAKEELQVHIEQKKVNIQIEVDAVKHNLLKNGEDSDDSLSNILGSGPLNKTLSTLIVNQFIKPKSKIVRKASIFIGSFLFDKYGSTLQKTLGKWLIKKDQQKIDGKGRQVELR